MRFKSKKQKGYVIYAVSGVNTISFAIDGTNADTTGLLGFAVERHDKVEDEKYFMYGFKVFQSVIPNPTEDIMVSTWDQPVQSFSWDDFTAKPAYEYDYYFYPIKGKAKNLDRSAPPVVITVFTEPLYSKSEEHDVFFNRGVAGSQAYKRKFGNLPPDKQETKEKKEEAYKWLTRDLEGALIKFINQAKNGDTLFACLYEFRYMPVLKAFKDAAKKGVDVQIIVDGKIKHNKEGDVLESFPRDDNMKLIEDAGLKKNIKKYREARPSDIQHNKFIVYATGVSKKPKAVWTGSTNISESGIFGQTNVGHSVRNEALAKQYKAYWDILSNDPGGLYEDSASEKRKKNIDFEDSVIDIQPDLTKEIKLIPKGITPVFSPRPKEDMLDFYAYLLDSAKESAYITLAFGVSDLFKNYLKDNTKNNHLVFMVLEKRDAPKKDKPEAYIKINASNNVYQANGSFISDTLYQWTKEVNTRILGLSHHVAYIHSKFMLIDPLGADPITVTGSANFSLASVKDNDENMMIIRGDKRVADIYFTEFMRLFNHYYFRTVLENLKLAGKTPSDDSLFLMDDDKWQKKYAKGTFKRKRLDLFRNMKDAKQG